jgi:hypothetical protein
VRKSRAPISSPRIASWLIISTILPIQTRARIARRIATSSASTSKLKLSLTLNFPLSRADHSCSKTCWSTCRRRIPSLLAQWPSRTNYTWLNTNATRRNPQWIPLKSPGSMSISYLWADNLIIWVWSLMTRRSLKFGRIFCLPMWSSRTSTLNSSSKRFLVRAPTARCFSLILSHLKIQGP